MCSNNDSFFGTDQFYANALHVLTAIELPAHAFGAYIILARTPKKMSTVKMSMFLLHFVGAFLDIYLSSIATPVLTLPMCAGYPLGISLWLGIPTDIQVYLGISFVGVIAVTILGFFEDRYHRLAYGHISNGEKSWKRKLYTVFHYVLSMTFIIPGYLAIPDQTIGRLETKKKIPCLPSEILNRQGFFVLAMDNTIPVVCLTVMIFIVLSQTLFFVINIALFLFRTVSKSQATNRLQKQFFVALCIQIFVPVTVLVIPVLYIVAAIWIDYFNQAWTNIALVVIALHGVLSTCTMLFVHKPYRDATLSVFHLNHKGTANESRSMWKTTNALSQVL